jgi:hypothetical protein
MQLTKERVLHLLELYSSRKATVIEEQELFQWLNTNEIQQPFQQHIQSLIHQFDEDELSPKIDWDSIYHQILQKTSEDNITFATSVKTIWPRLVAAVIIIVVVGFGAVYFVDANKSKPQFVDHNISVPKDINPGFSGAVLTLSNGNQILLDTAKNSHLFSQSGLRLINQNGQLSYKNSDANSNEAVVYNVMTTAKGRQYQLVLSDGTKVWLNASSSIKFPPVFSGKQRNVSITGEAYFEVAHNSAKPFNVAVNGANIHVLGTHFNVNAYEDELITSTTLLEGSVEITKENTTIKLLPGQQAQQKNTGEWNVLKDTDLDGVTAWKDGLFVMKNADIGIVMRQIARWYDIEIVYEGKIPSGHISGDIPRNMKLSKVLEVMQLSGVHFTFDGKKVIVKA